MNQTAPLPASAPTLLFVSPAVPHPAGIGVQQRAASHLEALARVARVHLVLALRPAEIQGKALPEAMQALCSTVDRIVVSASTNRASSALPGVALLRRLTRFGRPPLRIEGSAANEAIGRGLGATPFDVVFCFRLNAFVLWEQLRKQFGARAHRLFVDYDDVESIAARREIRYQKGRLGIEQTLVAMVGAVESAKFERRAQRRADAISVCSALDRERLESAHSRAQVLVVPNTCRIEDALPMRSPADAFQLLFVGTMSYPPNRDAVVYFCSRVLPLIQRRLNVELMIVGRNPGPEVQALGREPSVRVVGGVESMEPYYRGADVVVCPIRFGGGTRIKIIEALSFGRPVVSTTLGAEGLDLVSGRDLLLADDDASFADACVALLGDESLRRRLAASGRERVLATFDRRRVQERLAAGVLPSAVAAVDQ